MKEYFGRQYEIVVANADGDGRQWSGLSMSFSIEKTAQSEPNTATFSVYGLKKDSRAWIEQAAKVFFRAGYRDQIRTLFIGDVKRASSENDGINWVTEIECGDGQADLDSANVQASIAPGASAASLVDSLKDAVTNLDFSDGFGAAIMGAVPNLSGTTISGQFAAELSALLEPAGYEWSVQDGVVEVVRAGEAVGPEVLDLSASTGLLKAKKIDDGGVEVSALLSGLIQVNRPIRVASEKLGIDGFFVPKTVKHTGETDGRDWTTTAECFEL